MMMRILVFAGALLLAACDEAALPTGPQPGSGTAQQQLAAARVRWSATRPRDYEYTFQQLCFCPTEIVAPVRFEVSGGTGNLVTPVMERFRATFERYSTVEKLFDEIQTIIDREPAALTIEYDPQYAYPRALSVDYLRNAVDDEWSFTVSLFARR